MALPTRAHLQEDMLLDHGVRIMHPVEEADDHKFYLERKLDHFFESLSDGYRHTFGLNTERADLYSADALAQAYLDRTPWQRVKDIFVLDQNDNQSGEWLTIVSTGVMGFVLGGVIGFQKSTAGVRERFIEYHQATIFEHPADARRRLMDTVAFHGFRGGVRYGVKVALLSVLSCTVVAVITALRKKSGVVEYTAGGFAMGSLWAANRGLRASMSAGCLGGALGVVGGTIIYASNRLSGKTYEEIIYWRKLRQVNAIKTNLERQRQAEGGVEDKALRMHDVYKRAELLGIVPAQENDGDTKVNSASSVANPPTSAVQDKDEKSAIKN